MLIDTGPSTFILFSCFVPQEPLDLEVALKLLQQQNATIERTQPFLLKLGTSFFIVADSCPIIVKPPSLSVGVDTLLKSFFVWNVKYSKQVTVAYSFLQHVLLDIAALNISPKATKLTSELAKM